MRSKLYSLLVIFLVIIVIASTDDKKKSRKKITANDHYNFISINECLMWVSNNGDGSHNPLTDNNGFYWPSEPARIENGIEYRGINAIFEDGLVFAGKVGKLLRANGNTYRQGLQGGKILPDRTPDDSSKEKYRVYKIRKYWEQLPPGPIRDEYEKDYNDWPVEDGAPWIDVNGDGIFTKGIDEPEHIGDETLWYVSNDMDPNRSTRLHNTLPVGLEFQVTVFAFDRANYLGDAVFKKYKILNKGNNEVRDMYLSYWSDPDLGNAGDDFVGCDSLLNLGYCYNGDEIDDNFYGDNPPAVGYQYLQTPIIPGNIIDSARFDGRILSNYKNVPASSFSPFYNCNPNFPLYCMPDQGLYSGAEQWYKYMKGFDFFGNHFRDPETGQIISFVLAGDPESGEGWYEGDGWIGSPSPGDRKLQMSTGPFNLMPGDTQEVVYAIFMSRGNSRKNSVTKLKSTSKLIQNFYDNFYETPAKVAAPVTYISPGNKSLTLWWENNSENFSFTDKELAFLNSTDSVYLFEGYRIWQYEDEYGKNPRLIGIFDLENVIDQIYGYTFIEGERIYKKLFDTPNEGLIRSIEITKDEMNGGGLNNGKEYFFGVTAFAYSPQSKEPFVESKHHVISAKPEIGSIDYKSDFNDENVIYAEHVSGYGDAVVKIKIVDPSKLTGDVYSVKFEKYIDTVYTAKDSLAYSVINESTDDTLIYMDTTFVKYDRYFNGVEWDYEINYPDSAGNKTVDGFQVYVSLNYPDSLLLNGSTKYYVKGVNEISGPGGVELEEPLNVLNNYNSTGKWCVKAKGELRRFIWQRAKPQEGLGFDDYEIRFDGESHYYVSGIAPSYFPLTANDILGRETIPFSIWNIGKIPNDPSDDSLMIIKIMDFAKDGQGNNIPERSFPDSMYTHLENGDWEEIAVYKDPNIDPYNLPEESGRSMFFDHAFGGFVFSGELPEPGTVIRLSSVKPLTEKDVFQFTIPKPDFNDKEAAKQRIDEISVYPNPFFTTDREKRGSNKVTFTKLPDQVKVRIFALSGHLVKVLEKDDDSSWLDWDLTNNYGEIVGNGIFVAHLEMEGIGEKVLKIAVVK